MNKKIINRYIKRGYANIGKWMGLLLLPLLLFSSCVDDSVTSGSTTSSDSTQVRLTFNLQQQTSLTRSLSSTGTSESQVDNINVLIFDSNKKLIGSDYESFSSSKTASFSVSIAAHAVTGSCTIFAVANLPSDSLKNVASVEDFNKKFILMSSTATLGSGNNMIMFGKMDPVTISSNPSSNNFSNFTLTRLGSKVTFNITPATGITITGYQLCHVPMASYLTNGTDSTYYNPKGTYGNFDAVSGLTSITKVSPNYYMYENLVGRKSGATSFFSRGKANAPADASYLMVYAARADSGWTATYRIYLGGTGMSDYTNYNVPRNYNYTYNINIDGADEADVRVRCLPNIGDYYYSDGTFGTSKVPSKATVIGIVFSNKVSVTDSVNGWTHGYAMALTNAASSVTWSPNTSTLEFPLSQVTSFPSYKTELDGYTHCQTIKTKAGSNLSSNYPAFYYALNYSAYIAPSSSSGWYLPSSGQWYQIITNLGGISTGITPIQTTGSGLTYWYYSVMASTASSGINSYLSKVSGANLIDWSSSANRVYWCSNEASASYACAMDFGFGNLYLDFIAKTDASSYIRVRPVVAF